MSVFVSYAHSDGRLANLTATALESKGLACFVAHDDITCGTEFIHSLQTELSQADIVLVIVSKESIGSCWVNQEIGYAVASGALVLPMIIDETKPQGFLSTRQWKKIERTTGDGTGDGIANMNELTQWIFDAIMQRVDLGGRLIDTIIENLETSDGFIPTKGYWNAFSEIGAMEHLDSVQAERLANAILTNDQVYKYVPTRSYVRDLLRKKRSVLRKATAIRLESRFDLG